MRRAIIANLLLTPAICTLGACGGGGGGGGNGLISTPPPPPVATPSIRPIQIFPGIASSTELAALGLEAQAGGTVATSGFSVRFDAARNVYVIDLPSGDAGGFYEFAANTPNTRFWGGGLENPSAPGTLQPVNVSVLKPSLTNELIQLSYTSVALYDVSYGPPHGFLAFGLPTLAANVPVTGTASYSALVFGSTIHTSYPVVDGVAKLQFDFGAGTLAGHMTAVLSDGWGWVQDLGRYDFVNTVYGSGSASFSGSLTNPTVSGLGSFNGVFTGPGAQELMARWQAPYRVPETNEISTIFGVWVGKKDGGP